MKTGENTFEIKKYSIKCNFWLQDGFFKGYIYETNTRKQKQWNTGATNKIDAKKAVRDMAALIYEDGGTIETTVKNYSRKTVSWAIKTWMQDYKNSRQSRMEPKKFKHQVASNQCGLAHAERHIGHINLNDLNKRHFTDYVNARRKELKPNGEHFSESSILKEVNLLKTAIRSSLENGKGAVIIERCRGHEMPDDVIREDFMTLEQIELLIPELPEWMQFMIELQFWTGSRPSEIRELKWSEFFDTDMQLRIKDHKTKGSAGILIKQLNDTQVKKLKLIRKSVPKDDYGTPISPYVFLGPRGTNVVSQKVFYDNWHIACQNLGGSFIEYEKKSASGEPKSKYTPHSLRHSYNTFLSENGVPQKLAMKLTGHLTTKSHMRYQNFSDQATRDFVDNQENFFDKIREKELNKKKDDEKRTKSAQREKERIDGVWSSLTEDEKCDLIKDRLN